MPIVQVLSTGSERARSLYIALTLWLFDLGSDILIYLILERDTIGDDREFKTEKSFTHLFDIFVKYPISGS